MLQRTNIYLDSETIQRLKLLAAARGTTMSDLVRDAVEALFRTDGTASWRNEISMLLDQASQDPRPSLSPEEVMAELQAARSYADAAEHDR
jgi:post-segregation antitoxin (ccd killing protein)